MILALDFDGVMHPVSSRTEPKFCRLGLLDECLQARPDVRVLISSSRREVHPLAELVSFFPESLQARVVGATPLAHDLPGPSWSRSDAERAVVIGERQHEIEQWILGSDVPARPWIALDDDQSLFRSDCTRVVNCDPYIGLTEKNLDQLDALISNRLDGDDAAMYASKHADTQ